MILRLDKPESISSLPRQRDGLDYEKFWTLSQREMERMARIVNPSIYITPNKFRIAALYDAGEMPRVEQETGIFLYCWLHQVPGSRLRSCYFQYNYSKDHFKWHEENGFPVPIDASKYVMTDLGWDWAASRLYSLIGNTSGGWATQLAVMRPPRKHSRSPERKTGARIKPDGRRGVGPA